MSKLQTVITQVAIELIEEKVVLKELERAFPYLYSSYYWARKQQAERRVAELEEILKKARVGYEPDAPAEQFLIIHG